jgi:hypothetical protein
VGESLLDESESRLIQMLGRGNGWFSIGGFVGGGRWVWVGLKWISRGMDGGGWVGLMGMDTRLSIDESSSCVQRVYSGGAEMEDWLEVVLSESMV